MFLKLLTENLQFQLFLIFLLLMERISKKKCLTFYNFITSVNEKKFTWPSYFIEIKKKKKKNH